MAVPEEVSIPLGGGRQITLPVLPFSEDEYVGVLNCVDETFDHVDLLADALVDAMRAQNLAPEAVLCVPTQGYILGAQVARRLGLKRVYAVKKGVKIFESEDAMHQVAYGSITSGQSRLFLPSAWEADLRGKCVVLIEDVIATGGTLGATLQLCEAAGISIAGIFVAFVEGRAVWKEKLGKYADAVVSLGEIPVFSTANP